MYSVLDAVEVCSVAFEIYEQLKKEYDFFIIAKTLCTEIDRLSGEYIDEE